MPYKVKTNLRVLVDNSFTITKKKTLIIMINTNGKAITLQNGL